MPDKSARNVLGGPLETCSMEPKTGWFRNGCCDSDRLDGGAHLICVRVTAEFLAFSKKVGNDLSTPVPDYGFPGLKPGDRWCLCASRWVEAHKAGCAPLLYLRATHEGMLQYAPLELLQKHAAEMN